ncbi:hypothetical protein [Lactobacillus sp. W8093]|uniref:hypothetical protein n=1 Tax=Lactobacillus sp. W8093 TaxID=2751038 RepID=UPI0018F053BE|nr:hypothetical protein [Lactobacillus sp. W8093]
MKIGIRVRAPENLYSKEQYFSHFGFSLDQLKVLEKIATKYNFCVTSILIHQENKVYRDCSTLGAFINTLLKFDFLENHCVSKIDKNEDGLFYVNYGNKTIICKYLIVATGILTFPNILDKPEEVSIGLHTPDEMIKETVEKH